MAKCKGTFPELCSLVSAKPYFFTLSGNLEDTCTIDSFSTVHYYPIPFLPDPEYFFIKLFFVTFLVFVRPTYENRIKK
jgi:hypothetical protein